MAREKLGVVHAIEMIAGQNQERVDAPIADVRQYLAHGVGGPLKPLAAFRRLLSRKGLDERVGKRREAIGLRYVFVE